MKSKVKAGLEIDCFALVFSEDVWVIKNKNILAIQTVAKVKLAEKASGCCTGKDLIMSKYFQLYRSTKAQLQLFLKLTYVPLKHFLEL